MARATKLEKAGEASEATALLTEACIDQCSVELINFWVSLDEARLKALEDVQENLQMPPMAFAPIPFRWLKFSMEQQAEAEARGESAAKEKESVNFWIKQTVQELVNADMDTNAIAKAIESPQPRVLEDDAVTSRLDAYELCGRSMLASTSAISAALRSASADDVEKYVAKKAALRSLVDRLKKSRAAFVSYDVVAPKLVEACVELAPTEPTLLSYRVKDESLRRSATLLGEVRRDIEFAHKDVRRLWLKTLSTLKQHAGEKQFHDLETLASFIGDPRSGPEQWQPR